MEGGTEWNGASIFLRPCREDPGNILGYSEVPGMAVRKISKKTHSSKARTSKDSAGSMAMRNDLLFPPLPPLLQLSLFPSSPPVPGVLSRLQANVYINHTWISRCTGMVGSG